MSCELDQNCPYDKPGLGSQTAVVDDVGSTIVEIVGIGLTINGIAGVIAGFVSNPVTSLIITRVVGELGFGIIVAAVIWVMWGVKCENNPEGTSVCVSGIVDSLIPPATTTVSSLMPVDFLADAGEEIEGFFEQYTDLFPFMKEHPSFNLVVRCEDWERISDNSEYIWFNSNDQPYIICYQRDPDLCPKLLTAAIGATVGGVVGVPAGFWADAAFLALCGLSIFCAVLAIIVGMFIAGACAVAGAKIGYELGGATRVSSGEEEEKSQSIRVGDYVSVRGNMVKLEWVNNASAFYFVEEWCWYGHEDSALPPFDHMMARDFFLMEEGEDLAYLFCKLGINLDKPRLYHAEVDG